MEWIEVHSTFNTIDLRSEFLEEGERGEPQTPPKGSYIIELEDDEAGDNVTSAVVGPNAIIHLLVLILLFHLLSLLGFLFSYFQCKWLRSLCNYEF